MQQPTHTMTPMAPISPASITTDQIQKYLDENKQLILAILENQNLGKLAECAQYQAQLQKNLLYLAAIADAQPPTPTVRPQMVPHPAMLQQGSPFGQQVPGFLPRPPLQYNPQQIHEQQQQQQPMYSQVMPFPGHMGMRPGMMNGMPSIHAEHFCGTNSDLPAGPSRAEVTRGRANVPGSGSLDASGTKQDPGKLTTPHSSSAASADASSGAGTGTTDGLSSSAAQQGSGEATQSPAAMEKSEGAKTT